nr:hypothetical protein [uncultured Draconibacterium sp.]
MEDEKIIQDESNDILTGTENSNGSQKSISTNSIIQTINENKGFSFGEVGNVIFNERYRNPTTIWESKTNWSDYKIDKKEIKLYADQLNENRLIVLHCEDKGIIQKTIEDIVDYIIEKNKIKDFQKRLFSIQRKDDDIDNDKPYEENQESITLSTFIQENFAKGEICFIKTKLIQSEFFKSLFIEEKESFEAIKAELSFKNIFFICYVQEQSLLHTIQSKRHSSFSKVSNNIERNFFFALFEIPFLPIILQLHFGEKWTELRDIIISQKDQGLWGKGKTESELYNSISNYLDEGINKLEQEIEKRRKGDFKEKLANKIETLPFNKKVHQHILFITAFFPEISITEFNLLVNMLLEGKTDEQINKVVHKETDNEIKSIDDSNIIQPSEEWENKGDEILHECSIITSTFESGRIYFDFEEPELKDEVKTNFKKRYFLFLQEQFQTIINSGIFFKTKASKQLVHNLLDNLTEMVPYDPYFYGLNLLHWTFVRIFTDNKIQLKKKLEELNAEELSLVNDYVHQKTFEREVSFNRLLDFMRLMLDKSELLSRQVIDFIEFLFQKELFLIVLRIIEELQDASHINALEWIKRILNQKEAKGDIHYECIKSLYRIAKLSTYETFDILEKIQKWWVQRSSNGSLTLYQGNSILIILFFGNPLYGQFPLANYGKWPSKFFLFNFTENNVNDTWKFLVQWLFHYDMVKAYKIVDNQERTSNISIEDILIKVQAFILESWFLILNGIDNSVKLKPLQKKAINEFYSTLTNELSPIQLKKLKHQWALMSREYIQEASKFRRKNNSQLITLFTAKKEACRALYNKFNNL